MVVDKKIKNIVDRIQYYCESANEVIFDAYECKVSNDLAIKRLEKIVGMLCDESIHLNNTLKEQYSKYDFIVSDKNRETKLIKQINFIDETIEYKGEDSIIH